MLRFDSSMPSRTRMHQRGRLSNAEHPHRREFDGISNRFGVFGATATRRQVEGGYSEWCWQVSVE
jgi:hypothetical protein